MSAHSPASPRQLVWLFDQRFEPLRTHFRQYLDGRGSSNLSEVLGYQLSPDVGKPDGCGYAHLNQRSPEEVNQLFLDAWDAQRLLGGVPGAALVASFTMEGLGERPGLSLFGPRPDLVSALNDKTFQYPWLRAAGLPVPPFEVVPGLDRLHLRMRDLLDAHGRIFVQPAHSAGGELAGLIADEDQLNDYGDRLTAAEFDATGTPLVAARYLPGATSLSGHGLVTRHGAVLPLGIDELLLNAFRFDGFIFPTYEPPHVEAQALELTRRVGELLAARGYWGYFAVDFLHRLDSFLAINEVNVRFAGEAGFLAASMRHNLFALLVEGGGGPAEPLIPQQESRIVVTKIRPTTGAAYRPIEARGSVEAFTSGHVDAFRLGFHSIPVRVVRGHFIGLAGSRFDLAEKKETLLSFYTRARTP